MDFTFPRVGTPKLRRVLAFAEVGGAEPSGLSVRRFSLFSMSEPVLREKRESDLPVLFEIQCDPAGQAMAAFTDVRNDREAYLVKHRRLLAGDGMVHLVVEVDDEVVGSGSTWLRDGQPEVTYWIRRDHWGRGLAGLLLAELLERTPARPVFGGAAADNLASQRVLERAGFKPVRRERAFADARGEEIEEVLFRLD
jgi:[ribosomal protein S5]-alanine N-acetyltransferase